MAQEKTKPKKPKPIGSGIFSFAVGGFLWLIFICSHLFDLRKFDPYVLFQSWLLFAALILSIWGIVRIKKVLKEKKKVDEKKELDEKLLRWEIGQPTLNFVVGVLAATAAIFAFVL